jgi:DNA-directed RNA polymerase subunit RPC12/RpoP
VTHPMYITPRRRCGRCGHEFSVLLLRPAPANPMDNPAYPCPECGAHCFRYHCSGCETAFDVWASEPAETADLACPTCGPVEVEAIKASPSRRAERRRRSEGVLGTIHVHPRRPS